ncbi:protein CURVATURE THYLAKOID 1A, chloroplastic-like isoform X2 [Impatiens glandulifera]|uniref:protein CURVATURE THYLAKOID 1A, chloroplastic-like isoform X2 n=1 Tax=Impatiens glandulifera TaxID=253017 RepID=UPI001FB19743|nr:protein CURVATURE THYLAKOID 1A, chloroplastic-like isoform X2 [Impatiens glandulifera]
MATAASSTSMAAAAAVFIPCRFSATTTRFSSMPYLPPPPRFSTLTLSTSFKQSTSDSKRFQVIKASSEDSSSANDPNELLNDLKEKWDAVENKSTVIIYGGGAIVAIWLSSIVVGAINSVPLLPKIMELVGLGYTGWFVYRYLLFKQSRKELATDIDALKKKIAGSDFQIGCVLFLHTPNPIQYV